MKEAFTSLTTGYSCGVCEQRNETSDSIEEVVFLDYPADQ
jgi:hypothetical protein